VGPGICCEADPGAHDCKKQDDVLHPFLLLLEQPLGTLTEKIELDGIYQTKIRINLTSEPGPSGRAFHFQPRPPLRLARATPKHPPPPGKAGELVRSVRGRSREMGGAEIARDASGSSERTLRRLPVTSPANQTQFLQLWTAIHVRRRVC
jgi:hypothetical protein